MVFKYITRGRCACGFFWTTPGSPSVRCACGAMAITDNVLEGPGLSFTEAEFTAACADEIGVDPSAVVTDRVA